jgi:glycine dehydrogenase subunit 1
MGPVGLSEVARACYDNAHYLAGELGKIKGFELVNPGSPFFHEFLTQAPANTDKVLKSLEDAGILGGLPIEGGILWCATERNTKTQIDLLVETIKKAVIA